MRSDTNTSMRGMTSVVLIGFERSGQHRSRKKDFVRIDTCSRKCGCSFKFHGKPVVGGQGRMVKLMYGSPYVGRLTKDEKTIIADMTNSMVKPRNILLMLKEHNANSCITIKQIYNARSAYRSSIRDSDTEIQHLIKLLERDQYIHWHKLKDEDIVRDIFWCHLDVVKLCNACNFIVPTKQIGTGFMDKWMDITDMGYVIASRYNFILGSLSLQQSMTLFPLRTQPPTDFSVHCIICIGHFFGNHFFLGRFIVYLRDRCPLLPLVLLWSRNYHPQTKQ
ncbi:hypothetical protein HKD37_09G025115 [Glycine soja]